MDDFWSIFQLLIIVFFAVQLERMNHTLREIQKALLRIAEQNPSEKNKEKSNS